MKSIFGRIALGLGLFVACTAICLFGWYVAASMSLATAGPIMGSGGRSFSSGESVTFFFFLILPLIVYPASAWFSRKLLGSFPSILLGLSPILLPFLFFWIIDFLRFLDRKKYEHPIDGVFETVYQDQKEGEQKMTVTYKDNKLNGEMIRYCPDGTVFYQGSYERDLMVGEHKERENCWSNENKVTTYSEGETIIDVKRFSTEHLIHHYYVENPGKKDRKTFSLSYKWNKDRSRRFLYQERVTFDDGSKEITKEYNEKGELISEKVLPENPETERMK